MPFRAVCFLFKHLLRGLALTALGAVVGLGLISTAEALFPWPPPEHPSYYENAEIAIGLVLLLWPLWGVLVLALYRRRMRDKNILSEAEAYLSSRTTQSIQALRQSGKLERRALWGPTGLVLVLFVFFPETFGLISHLFYGRLAQLGPYRVETPLTWTIFDERDSGVFLLPGKGIARVGLGPYRRREELGSASFAFIPESERSNADWYLKYRKPLSEQRLSLGKRTFICWNFVPWYEASTVETRASFVDVACRTEDRDFSATFSGERGEVATFYHVLETIRQLK